MNPKRVFDLEIIFLVPQQIKNVFSKFPEIDKVLSFSDLSIIIDHPYSVHWEIILSNLKTIRWRN